MGATIVAFWSGLVGFVYCDRHFLWNGFLDGATKKDYVDGCFTFCSQYIIQFNIHSSTVWIKEQSFGINRYFTCPHNVNLGNDSNLPTRSMDCLRANSVSSVGLFCHSVAINSDLSK